MPIVTSANDFWQLAPKGDVHEKVFPHVEAVEHEQSDVRVTNRHYARLYSNRFEPGLESGSRGFFRSGFFTVTENLVQSVIDASVSMVAKSKPKVAIMTDNGDWSLQRLARKLDRYLLDMFRKLEVHEKMSMAFRDAAIFGTGCLKFFERDGEIGCDRVLIDEIIVDESEVPSGGMPRQVHQIRPVAKDVLKQLFPGNDDAIDSSSEFTSHRFMNEFRLVDPNMVMVVESWILPAGPNSPGRHTIVVEKETLLDEEYTKDFFPFMFFKYSQPLTGFYGQGLAEGLLGFQIRQNELNDFARKAFDLISVPRVFVEHGAKLLKPQLTNEIGQVIPYVGRPPQWFTPTALSNEYFSLHQQNRDAAFEFAGISRMAAQATRPVGIEAGVALRELSDNQSQRLSNQQQRYENRHIDVGLMILELSSDMGKGKRAKTEFEAKNLFQAIDWKAYRDSRDNLRFNVQAASSLNDTPSARKQTAIEFAQYGVPVRPDEIRRLINHPDLELSDRRATAALENIEWLITELSEGRYHSPQPFQDLGLGMERVTAAYLEAWQAGAPEDVLENYRQWITQAEELLKQAQQDQLAQQQGAPPAEGGDGLASVPGDVVQEQALAGLFR